MSEDKTVIEKRDNGPLVVKSLKAFTGSDGVDIEPKPVIALCRCGASKNKPYCDGSHEAISFDGSESDVAHRDRIYSYEGKEGSVHYNKLLCSHAGECGKRASEIFNPRQKPWVQPDKGTLDQVKDVIAACPSGALRHSTPDGEPEHIVDDECAISIEANGPYRVKNIDMETEYWAEGQTQEKYVLCRCGLSKNKPFCDGTHSDKGWKDGS